MNNKFAAFALSGVFLCTMSVHSFAAGVATSAPNSVPTIAATQPIPPDSILYYGQVKEIVKSEDEKISQLCMDSERYGEYIFNISDETAWIDNGNKTAADPSDLKEGDRLYVFHSRAKTASIPPQSAAFAIVRNIPQDAGCTMYHEVEAVSKEDGKLKITTDNGSLFLFADAETKVLSYLTKNSVTLDDIHPGSYIMAWYEAVAESYPGQTYANHIMVLPKAEMEHEKMLTRADLVSILHNQAGNPVVNYAMDYKDVDGVDSYAEAIRWATGEKLVGGYGDGSFGPDDAVNREQCVTILWRYAGSPMLMDYPGLMHCSDVGDISPFARKAMAWAHQKGIISDKGDGILAPQGFVTTDEVMKMIEVMGTN